MTDEQKILKAFIDCNQYSMKDSTSKTQTRQSCFVRLLFDARMIVGRKVNSGEIDDNHNGLFNREEWKEEDKDWRMMDNTRFVGLSLYLFLLDMVGMVFKDKNYSGTFHINENALKKALKQFAPSLSKKEMNTIISLRNCLAHNYGLIALPKNHNANNWNHQFTLIYSPDKDEHGEDKIHPMIAFPDIEWNGKYEERHLYKRTEIYKPKLVQLIEDIVKSIGDKLNNDEIELALAGGIEELKARFTVH